MTSPKEYYEDKGYKPQDVALAIIGAGLANAIALVALSTPLTLWNTIVGIIIRGQLYGGSGMHKHTCMRGGTC